MSKTYPAPVSVLSDANVIAALSKGDLEGAMDTARALGAKSVIELVDDPEMLLPAEMAARLGIPVLELVAMKARKEILGLGLTGHGLHYPSWQLGRDDRPLPGLGQVLAEFEYNAAWRCANFLLARDRHYLKMLAAGEAGEVASLARRWNHGLWL